METAVPRTASKTLIITPIATPKGTTICFAAIGLSFSDDSLTATRVFKLFCISSNCRSCSFLRAFSTVVSVDWRCRVCFMFFSALMNFLRPNLDDDVDRDRHHSRLEPGGMCGLAWYSRADLRARVALNLANRVRSRRHEEVSGPEREVGY